MNKPPAHITKGQQGEDQARHYLEQKGYTILHRNWRSTPYELDIVAMDGPQLVFVEVRTRSTSFFGNPEDSVDARKQRKLSEAAEAYLDENDFEGEVRFDVIAIVQQGNKNTLHHITDAFFPSE